MPGGLRPRNLGGGPDSGPLLNSACGQRAVSVRSACGQRAVSVRSADADLPTELKALPLVVCGGDPAGV
jgi:hypothetical protein